MRKLVTIGLWIIFLGGLLVLLGFVEVRHNTMTCCQFNLVIDYDDTEPLLDAEKMKNWIITKVDPIQGKPIEMIDTERIKALVQTNPFVRKANVYTTIEGHLNVKIWQRKPVLRVLDHKGRSFYIDEEGIIVPTTHGHSARVRVANGFIADQSVKPETLPLDTDTLPSNSIYYKLLKMNRYIDDHEFMDAQIDQIYVKDNGELELIPKLGQHVVLFGDINDMEEKFEKLEAFYRKGIRQTGWDKYKQINLKFKHQIVCSKR